MMGIIALGISALAVGAMLARRYLGAVLVPMGFVFFLVAVAWGILRGLGFAGVALAAVFTVTALDLGYVLGFFVWGIFSSDRDRTTSLRRRDSRGAFANRSFVEHIRAVLQFGRPA